MERVTICGRIFLPLAAMVFVVFEESLAESAQSVSSGCYRCFCARSIFEKLSFALNCSRDTTGKSGRDRTHQATLDRRAAVKNLRNAMVQRSPDGNTWNPIFQDKSEVPPSPIGSDVGENKKKRQTKRFLVSRLRELWLPVDMLGDLRVVLRNQKPMDFKACGKDYQSCKHADHPDPLFVNRMMDAWLKTQTRSTTARQAAIKLLPSAASVDCASYHVDSHDLVNAVNTFSCICSAHGPNACVEALAAVLGEQVDGVRSSVALQWLKLHPRDQPQLCNHSGDIYLCEKHRQPQDFVPHDACLVLNGISESGDSPLNARPVCFCRDLTCEVQAACLMNLNRPRHHPAIVSSARRPICTSSVLSDAAAHRIACDSKQLQSANSKQPLQWASGFASSEVNQCGAADSTTLRIGVPEQQSSRRTSQVSLHTAVHSVPADTPGSGWGGPDFSCCSDSQSWLKGGPEAGLDELDSVSHSDRLDSISHSDRQDFDASANSDVACCPDLRGITSLAPTHQRIKRSRDAETVDRLDSFEMQHHWGTGSATSPSTTGTTVKIKTQVKTVRASEVYSDHL